MEEENHPFNSPAISTPAQSSIAEMADVAEARKQSSEKRQSKQLTIQATFWLEDPHDKFLDYCAIRTNKFSNKFCPKVFMPKVFPFNVPSPEA